MRLDAVVELGYWVDADVLLPPGEVDHWPTADAEGRNCVADRLLGAWNRGMDDVAYCLQFGLHRRREAGYVVIY